MGIDLLSAGLKIPKRISVPQIINYRKRILYSIFNGELAYSLRIHKEG
jgi:hypothetical protein